MTRHGAWRRAALVVGMVVAGWLASGCGSSSKGAAGSRFESWPTVTLIAFKDQMTSALPRYYDIANLLFKKDLAAGTIQFRYNPSTSANCLVGEIKGWNLKPNFCYQLKLVGKPGTASGGLWGTESDVATNRHILANGRWWNYNTDQMIPNTTDAASVLSSPEYAAGWVAGYVYFGYVLTDEAGAIRCFGGKDAPVLPDADGWVPISANRCYHITGKSGQEGMIQQTGGTPIPYTLKRTSYGYTGTTATANVSLWYEKEGDNALDFALPDGDHDVVLMVTEESFHNKYGDGTATDGGFWDTVWVSDWSLVSKPTGTPWVTRRGGRIQFATGAADAAPTATIVTPVEGGTVQVNSIVPVQVKAIASLDLAVTVSIDGGTAQTAVYNEDSTCYEVQWNTAGLALDSSHTLVATATDTAGVIGVDTSAVTVTGNHAPVASFTSTQNGKAFTFASTSTDSDGTIAAYRWTFGDGGTAKTASASHTYASSGTYTVTLVVTDNLGATSAASKKVAANVMTPTVTVKWLPSSGRYQANAEVLVVANGVPLSGVTVSGAFSGTYSKSGSATTGSTGKAVITGTTRLTTTGPLTFTVTKLTKSGYTAAGLPVSGSY